MVFVLVVVLEVVETMMVLDPGLHDDTLVVLSGGLEESLDAWRNLLVVRVEADGSWEELFYGDFQASLSLASWSSRDSKHSISVKALRSLGQRIQEAEGIDP